MEIFAFFPILFMLPAMLFGLLISCISITTTLLIFSGVFVIVIGTIIIAIRQIQKDERNRQRVGGATGFVSSAPRPNYPGPARGVGPHPSPYYPPPQAQYHPNNMYGQPSFQGNFHYTNDPFAHGQSRPNGAVNPPSSQPYPVQSQSVNPTKGFDLP